MFLSKTWPLILRNQTINMEVLKFSKKFWKYISAVYLPDNANRHHKISSVILNLIHVSGLIITICASLSKLYYEKYEISVGHRMMIFLQMFANSIAVFQYTFYCFRKSQIVELIEFTQKIVDKRYNASTAVFYENAESNAKFFTKWPFVVYIVFFDVMIFISTVVYLVYSLIKGEMNVNKWPNIIQVR